MEIKCGHKIRSLIYFFISFLLVGELWKTSDHHERLEYDHLWQRCQSRATFSEASIQRKLSQSRSKQTQWCLRAGLASFFGSR